MNSGFTRITAHAELCQIFALLRVCGWAPAGLLVLGPKSEGPNRTIFDVWCSDPCLSLRPVLRGLKSCRVHDAQPKQVEAGTADHSEVLVPKTTRSRVGAARFELRLPPCGRASQRDPLIL